jgi:ribosomal protein S18 acetylase RimI-like enzyme
MISYRAPTTAEAGRIAELGRSSFIDAFGHLYSQADLDAFLATVYAPEAVAGELASAKRAFRVAERNEELLGYCKLGFDLSLDYDPGERRVMELKQLYLRGARTGDGIGTALMEWALSEARQRGFDAVLLSVWSENHGAQRFYRRFGFEKWGDTIFMVGNQRDEEFLFGLNL